MTPERRKKLGLIHMTKPCGEVWTEFGECLDEIDDRGKHILHQRTHMNELSDQLGKAREEITALKAQESEARELLEKCRITLWDSGRRGLDHKIRAFRDGEES